VSRTTRQGLEYLRARYYDTETGRFLAEDPIPLLHRYPYVDNNPVNFDDPSGLCKFKWFCAFGDRSGGPKVDESFDPIEVVDGWVNDRANEAEENLQRIAQAAGYVDINGTACSPVLWACGTVGVRASFLDGLHPYVGTGVGEGLGISASWAPGQRISTGLNCGPQLGYGIVSAQAGRGGMGM
jgi:hypothetical protein